MSKDQTTRMNTAHKRKAALWFWKHYRLPSAKTDLEAFLGTDITNMSYEDIRGLLNV